MGINIAESYKKQEEDRQEYIDAAQEIAELTIPSLKPNGLSVDKDKGPYSYQGAKSLRSLSSALFKAMMPSGIRWGQLAMSPEDMNIIEDLVGPEPTAMLTDRMSERSGEVIERLEQKLSRSRGAKALKRNVVEGNTMVVDQPAGLRVFPLRSFVVDRVAGHIRSSIVKEVVDPEPLVEDKPKDGEPDAPVNYYTLIRYPVPDPMTGEMGGTPGVWTQKGEDGEAKGSPGRLWQQYIVTVPELPELDNYSFGYAHDFMRLFKQVEHAEQSLGEAMSAAAYNRPIIKEGSTTATRWERFASGRSGDPWVGNIEDLAWFVSAVKIGDWEFVARLLDRYQMDLQAAFSAGIADRPVAADASATAVLQMIDELATQIQDLHTAYEETFQRPLFRAELAAMEVSDPLISEDLIAAGFPQDLVSRVKIEITTGVSVLSKQQSLLKFAQVFLPSIKALDPLRLQIEGGPIVEAYANSLSFPTDKFWKWDPSPPAPPPAPNGNQAGDQGGREETIMTRGGPQVPQPPPPAPAS